MFTLTGVKQRAQDFLLRRLIQPSSNATAKTQEADGAIAAYEAVELLTADEARYWASRYAVDDDSGEINFTPDSELAARAVELIDLRIAGLATDGADDSLRVSHLLGAFQRIGLVSSDEAELLFGRLWADVEETTPEIAEGPESRCSCVDLESFVLGPPERRGGVRITGFDLYADGVVVRAHVVRLSLDENGVRRHLPDEVESAEAAQGVRGPFFSLHDDLGTAYPTHGGGGGGYGNQYVDRVRTHFQSFGLPVPREAQRLWAINEATEARHRFEVTLS